MVSVAVALKFAAAGHHAQVRREGIGGYVREAFRDLSMRQTLRSRVLEKRLQASFGGIGARPTGTAGPTRLIVACKRTAPLRLILGRLDYRRAFHDRCERPLGETELRQLGADPLKLSLEGPALLPHVGKRLRQSVVICHWSINFFGFRASICRRSRYAYQRSALQRPACSLMFPLPPAINGLTYPFSAETIGRCKGAAGHMPGNGMAGTFARNSKDDAVRASVLFVSTAFSASFSFG